MGKKFLQLVEESVIFQGALVIMVSGTVCIMYLRGQPVPNELTMAFAVIIGYFFGAKESTAVAKVAKRSPTDR